MGAAAAAAVAVAVAVAVAEAAKVVVLVLVVIVIVVVVVVLAAAAAALVVALKHVALTNPQQPTASGRHQLNNPSRKRSRQGQSSEEGRSDGVGHPG